MTKTQERYAALGMITGLIGTGEDIGLIPTLLLLGATLYCLWRMTH